MLIEQTFFGETNKVEEAVRVLRSFEPPEGYWLAFSGGKDSVVCKALCDIAGVKYEAHYCVTSVDPPELVRFVKSFPDVRMDIPHDDNNQPITMWNLIPKKLMPPTRLVRYCCEALKESSGEGRLTITGIRKAESVRRASQGALVKSFGSDTVMLNNDNDDSREIVEACYRYRKMVLNPIIDWEDDDVWEFIRTYRLRYCELYDQGYKRLGCIGCPMSTHAKDELEKYPKFREAYIRAFDRMIAERRRRGLPCQWDSGEDVMSWWLGNKRDRPLEGQLVMEGLPEEE